LLRKFGSLRNDLNTRVELRLSVLLAYIFLLSIAGLVLSRWAIVPAAAALAGVALLNRSYYRWFAQGRGWWFAVRVFPAHVLHHMCNGVSFVIGTALFAAQRAGFEMPGAISPVMWPLTAPMPRSPSKFDYV
jgi:hypothetical protein